VKELQCNLETSDATHILCKYSSYTLREIIYRGFCEKGNEQRIWVYEEWRDKKMEKIPQYAVS
jgi:hypothetical protein